MRYSKLFPKTLKEAPKDEVSINAKYLMRGGFIDKLMAGSYTLLPLGHRVVQKINEIIRQEMNATGAQEVLMPLLHPKEIWNETGRWDSAKEVMYQFEKNEREYALSFTHEEIVMDLIRKHVSSYKDLPVMLYHFSTKFRNELRAKSGILRGREFMMKDLYSAHATKEDLMKYYWEVADAYLRIFERLGVKVYVTDAAGGVFTDDFTHEFQLPSDAGEDTIYIADGWDRAKNEEVMTDEDRKAPGLKAIKSIEVGNIFPFGTKKYAEMMGGMFTDVDGGRKPVWFASYGIGPTRLMGALVEVSHDDKGIIWPESVAPYKVHLISITGGSDEVRVKADKVYEKLLAENIEVLYDDRDDVGPGQKFADFELIGNPHRVVVSIKTGDQIEWKRRFSDDVQLLSLGKFIDQISS